MTDYDVLNIVRNNIAALALDPRVQEHALQALGKAMDGTVHLRVIGAPPPCGARRAQMFTDDPSAVTCEACVNVMTRPEPVGTPDPAPAPHFMLSPVPPTLPPEHWAGMPNVRAYTIGHGMPGVIPLPIESSGPVGLALTRWALTDADRRQLFSGADIYVAVQCGQSFPPMFVTVGPIDFRHTRVPL